MHLAWTILIPIGLPVVLYEYKQLPAQSGYLPGR